MALRVMILEDQKLLRDLLISAVKSVPALESVGGFSTVGEARNFLTTTAVDMVILDLQLPDGSGMDLIADSQERDIRVVIVTGMPDAANAREALLRGVDAFVRKDESYEVLHTALVETAAGRPYYSPQALALLNPAAGGPDQPSLNELTPREREILIALASSESVKETAARCGIAAPTVKTHRLNVMRKLGIHDVAGLTRFAMAQGLVSSSV
ncbi:MAG: response regulator transcription factor [Synoicihabitans sp.]